MAGATQKLEEYARVSFHSPSEKRLFQVSVLYHKFRRKRKSYGQFHSKYFFNSLDIPFVLKTLKRFIHQHRDVSYLNMHTLHKSGRTIKFKFCHHYLPGVLRILIEKYLINEGDVFKLLEVFHYSNDIFKKYCMEKYAVKILDDNKNFKNDKHFKFASFLAFMTPARRLRSNFVNTTALMEFIFTWTRQMK